VASSNNNCCRHCGACTGYTPLPSTAFKSALMPAGRMLPHIACNLYMMNAQALKNACASSTTTSMRSLAPDKLDCMLASYINSLCLTLHAPWSAYGIEELVDKHASTSMASRKKGLVTFVFLNYLCTSILRKRCVHNCSFLPSSVNLLEIRLDRGFCTSSKPWAGSSFTNGMTMS